MSRRGQPGLRLVLLVAVPLVAIAGGLFWWLSGGRYVSTDNAYVKAHIVQIAPEVSGQVRRVPVHDHASVAAGETLFTIESRPFRLALDSAEAELDAARTQVETLRGTWREAVSELADAEARAAYFLRQSQRQEELAIKGVASVSKRDESQNDARAAADRVSTVREKLQRVLTALNGDPQLPADEHPMVRDKTAARERAALDLARTTVRAPVDGVVVNLRVQQGEQVKAATPLFALVVVSRPVGRGQFQGDRAHARAGRPEGHGGARHLSRHDLGGGGRKPEPGDRRGIRHPAAAERQRELGQGRAAPAGEAAAAAAGRRARDSRRHDRDGEDRHRSPAPCRRRGADA